MPEDELTLQLLHDGAVDIVGRMPWSSNATFLVDLRCGETTAQAIYKPLRGERPLALLEKRFIRISVSKIYRKKPPRRPRGFPNGRLQRYSCITTFSGDMMI